jgi:ABC-type Zn uptake system ZnuABC Zn-binding protein ZnuA
MTLSRKSTASLAVAVCAAALLSWSGCGHGTDVWDDVPGGPPRVLVSFPPLYSFTANVAGPDAGVMSLLTTVGPHNYEPTRRDHLKVRKADLFLMNGLGLDNFVTRIVSTSGNPRIKVIAVGEAIPKEQFLRMEEGAHEETGTGHKHSHGYYDPHVWLGIPEAVKMVERIRDVLRSEDPQHAEGYTKRAAAYVDELHKLQKDGQKLFAGKDVKVIATHDSLRYFARSFGLTVVANIQPQPGIEADAVKLKHLMEICRTQKVRIITVEPQYSRATAETLGQQLKNKGLNVHLVEVDTLETADPPLDAGYYVRRMRANLDALAKAL